MGDFNIDLLKIDSHNETCKFYDILSANGFRPLILQPTRVTLSSATLIDNIFINSMETESIGGNITTSISDHFPQFCSLDILKKPSSKNREKYGRSYRNFSQLEFEEDLKQIEWETLLLDKSSDESLAIFYGTIEQLLDEMAPVKN